jgi:chromosome partitioning protein
MKSIATINFKGGVGKTTITWLVAKYAAERRGKKVLVVDIDAQMSLTLAVTLQETGEMFGDFENWYENQHQRRQRTLFNALEKYDSAMGGYFDFPIDSSFIYQMTDNLYFVPSIVDLYWLELEVFDREKVKHFISALLGKIEHSHQYNFNYVFFDCPPNFTSMSYSVLSCSSLIVIPVNPDVFASRGISLMIEGLQYRVEPWPNPNIGVFMNKAKLYRGRFTRETQSYWDASVEVCRNKRADGLNILTWESYIPDRVDIKRAIQERVFPMDYEASFAALFNNIEAALR